MSEEIRLQVYLSRSGVASRRASATLISDGRVQVNGKVVKEPGFKVSSDDRVVVDGVTVALEEDQIYLAMNKPSQVICSADDPEGRMSVLDIVAGSFNQRLFTVGRLDFMTTGLIILTNDGDFSNLLAHPRSGIIKKYRVEAKDQVPRELLEKWSEGIRIKGVLYRLQSFFYEGKKTVILSLTEGKNREIRNVFASAKITIRKLERIQYGGLSLGNLKPGKFRELSKDEIENLSDQARKLRSAGRRKPSGSGPRRGRRSDGGKKQDRR